MSILQELVSDVRRRFNQFHIYPESYQTVAGCELVMIKADGKKLLLLDAAAGNEVFAQFTAEYETSSRGERQVKLAPLSAENAKVVRKYLPFTAPVAFGKTGMSIGLGDRLGLASPGHLRVLKDKKVRPVLAQQSIRELNLTNRTYHDVLDAATWGVLQEGYKEGFAADGDHLKTAAEVQMALDIGFTMITLDCSEHIDNRIPAMTAEQKAAAYAGLPEAFRAEVEREYLHKSFVVGGQELTFDVATVHELALVYGKALDHVQAIYRDVLQPFGREVDFEISIDETATRTTVEAHYFVAAQLTKKGINFASVAPRFIGEFQKAIDYIGDVEEFTAAFVAHAAIADKFGYRLSIHSGSDKFSVFPVIGSLTKGRVHVKTAGTNWLEALKVLSLKAPGLFRDICRFAYANFGEAAKYYHVTTNLSLVPDVNNLSDSQLPLMLEQNDARQLLHITYGLILSAKKADGSALYRDGLYQVLNDEEETYYQLLENHIGRHLSTLTIETN